MKYGLLIGSDMLMSRDVMHVRINRMHPSSAMTISGISRALRQQWMHDSLQQSPEGISGSDRKPFPLEVIME